MELSVHGSYDRHSDIIPADVVVTEHHYTGEPFSHWYILTKGDKIMEPVYFGSGGYYPDVAGSIMWEFFQ